ncbi:MAG: amino acid adenylation domain-containing protein [Candidatus Aminicenantes bacterium]|nr:amino acid adenylation domain-containing protein [Candidatus Aminicenantes bacterium]
MDNLQPLDKQTVVSSQHIREENYWLQKLSGELEKTVFPPDFPAAAAAGGQDEEPIFAAAPFRIDGDLFVASMKLSSASHYRMHMVLAAGLAALLYRYTGNKDILLGAPAVKQEIEADFVNTVLVLRNRIEAGMSFKELLLQVRQTITEAAENQNYPLETLLYQLGMPFSPAENFPLFDVVILLENIHDKAYIRHIKTGMRFYFRVEEETGACEGTVEYNPSSYEKSSIKRIIEHFKNLLHSVFAHIEQPLSGIEILTSEEKQQLLYDFNDNAKNYPKDKTIHKMFAEQAAKTPAAVALTDGEANADRVTYEQLEKEANRLAHLLQSRGVGPNTIVGIAAHRSAALVTGLLGIIKAGGAYLPVDPGYPQERIRFMLRDSSVEILILEEECDLDPDFFHAPGEKKSPPAGEKEAGGASESTAPGGIKDFIRLGSPGIDAFDAQPPLETSAPGDLIYTIYTSGSTGRPKGVAVAHRGLVNLIYCHREIYAEKQGDRVSQAASPAFDAMATEVWPCLTGGAALYIVPDDIRADAPALKEWLLRNDITVSFQPTVMAELLLAEEWPETNALRVLRTAGDKLTRYPTRQHSFRFYNMYGPTEDTVWTTWTPVEAGLDKNRPPTIGKPVPNHQVYILNSYGAGFFLQPVGVPGELCIGGSGVCAGYLNRPQLTAEKFIENPFLPGERMYRSGDLARWLPGGDIEFLGRIDQQVKIRGFRIELGEIEECLKKHDKIKDAVVTAAEKKAGQGDDPDAGEEDDRFICAYIVPRGEYNLPEVKEFLSARLPGYMIPACFVQLEKIPLTPNGKIDRKALPEPEFHAEGEGFAAPATPLEKKLADIWAGILKMEPESISIDMNFFDHGGHSLNATQLLARVNKELDVKVPLGELFKRPKIRELSGYIETIGEDTFIAVEAVEERDYYAMSSAQKRLYILQDIEPRVTSYNLPVFFKLAGKLNREKLEDVFSRLVARHESFRTSFHTVEGMFVQRVHKKVDFKIEYYDITAGEEELVKDIVEPFIRSFDLSKAPLLRTGLVKIAGEEYLLMVDMHHVISDGVSSGILVEEFMKLYDGAPLSPLRLQYKDFSSWQESRKGSEAMQKQEDSWLRQFADEIPVLQLPYDYSRPAVQSFAGRSIHFKVSPAETAALRKLSSAEDATLYIVLIAIFNVFLFKISGREDIIIGTPTAARMHADLQKIIGMFVNTLALRSFPARGKTFAEFLSETKERTLTAFENQEYPFEDLIEKSAARLNRDMSRNPLFDVLFILQNMEIPDLKIPGLTLSAYEAESKVSKFDLTLMVFEAEEELILVFEYCTKLFKEETIHRFIDYFKKLLSGILADPGKELAQFDILSQEEKNKLLYDFNDTETPFPTGKTIHRLFEEQVEKNPDNTAIIWQGEGIGEQQSRSKAQPVRMTYGELSKRTARMARLLRQKGVKPGVIAAIQVERSLEMIIGILGILQAGGVYLPIDPGYPRQRISFLLSDSSAALLLTHRDIAGIEQEAEPPGSGVQPGPGTKQPGAGASDPAYVIYTSGSTGQPKGVIVEHRSVVNLLFALDKEYPFGAADVYLLKTSYIFDVSVSELFGWFPSGGRVGILEQGVEKDPAGILDTIEALGITHINFVPSMFNAFMEFFPSQDISTLSSLKYIFLAGEALLPGLANKFRQLNTAIRLENIYGPTEATVYCSKYSLSGWPGSGSIPIGKPLANMELFVLDKTKGLQPIGAAGELWVGGVCTARGYLNNPELTAEKFQLDFYKSGKSDSAYSTDHPSQITLYRTGDLARWLPGGDIEFLGRIDQQVKIRGFRIETGEIENRLLNHEKTAEALVIAKADSSGAKYLCAYIVAKREARDAGQKVEDTANREQAAWIGELREYLSQSLPEYMMPSYFVFLDRFPLTPGGKVDRRALPEPETRGTGAAAQDILPAGEIEAILMNIWCEVLAVDRIGREDNFFQVGGDSIKVIQIAAKLMKHRLKLAGRDLFLYPTIKQLAKRVKRSGRPVPQEPVTGTAALTPIQRWFFDTDFLHPHHFNQSLMVFSEKGFNETLMEKVFTGIVSHHDALRMVFTGSGDAVEQKNRGLEGKLFDLEIVDFRDKSGEQAHAAIEKECARIQAGINLETGPLLKAALFKTAAGDHLAMVIHHLVVDGVSWRILLEDFAAAYAQAGKGEEIVFQEKTGSFLYWAGQLQSYAGSRTLQAEAAYWREIEKIDVPLLPRAAEIKAKDRKLKDCESQAISLSEQDTGALLQKVNRAYNTGINDILLTALGMALEEWAGIDKIAVNLEGHGREPIVEELDISRTIGWFTSLYPVLLDMSRSKELSYRIKYIKETLHRVPARGTGYGILKYLTQADERPGLSFQLEPGICFNYLGRFGTGDLGGGDFEISPLSSGANIGPGSHQAHALDITGILMADRLSFSFSYHKYEFEGSSIKKLAESFQKHLITIIRHCENKEKTEITPADVGSKISIEDLKKIEQVLGPQGEIESVYPLTSMQSGMLYEALSDRVSNPYFEQSAISIEGEIDRAIFEKSMNKLIERYAVLRTAFVYEDLDEPMQVVLKKRELEIGFEDISHLDADNCEQHLEEFKRKDRQRGMDLTLDHLVRLHLFKKGENSFCLIWDFFHTIQDGWCLGLIYNELLRIYVALKQGSPVELEPVTPYVEYIRWLEKQDKKEGLEYWRQYLNGYKQQAALPKFRDSQTGVEAGFEREEYDFSLGETLSAGVQQAVRAESVTLNTLFQALWGILLQKYNNSGDVVFGGVVSGRPGEVPGIERMVGLFINTVPVRIRNEKGKSFSQLLKDVHRQEMISRSYEYFPLMEIQSCTALGNRLIDHVLVFENFPLEELFQAGGRLTGAGFTVTDVRYHEQTNFDLNIKVVPGKDIALKYTYNALAYSAGFMEKAARNLVRLVEQVVENPGIEVDKIEISSGKEAALYDDLENE